MTAPTRSRRLGHHSFRQSGGAPQTCTGRTGILTTAEKCVRPGKYPAFFEDFARARNRRPRPCSRSGSSGRTACRDEAVRGRPDRPPVHIRDSRSPTGPTLTINQPTWASFLGHVKAHIPV
ncbi:DUF397 domain-containing protein [Streptomyces sp. AA8]|uniref:DUF397 domain-containing protein n=2 Tax=Streptomyces telluris TaxID=2720021 RepID=A0A9X2LF11_9ACTN|nr:DUF397 domain-containing protein [Streptomyces telluris]NJP75997.1 DUF397 domain-containing protein [Streptomyces telluris]